MVHNYIGRAIDGLISVDVRILVGDVSFELLVCVVQKNMILNWPFSPKSVDPVLTFVENGLTFSVPMLFAISVYLWQRYSMKN